MSLFKVRNWWKTQCPTVESAYDSFSLHCARLCLEEGEKDSIVVGSHSGQLCIYRPSGGQASQPDFDAEDEEQPAIQTANTENVFQHADVIVEMLLPHPVLAVSSGKFTTASKSDTRLQLVVLHPMRLCIYQIVTIDGLADHGDHTRLVPLSDHPLTKPAFSLCHGPFGGVKGREFLCVQHLDGSLRFFEQDGISYDRTLATDRHIPTPLHYVQRVDCFVTVTPAWVLECYRYQDIAEALESVRRHDPIWSLCVGEYALDLQVHQVSNTESVIVVLGENNLLCVSDTGKVQFIKKLDYSPMCFHAFVAGWYWEPGARLMLAVVSESGSLLLYESDQIIWSAQLGQVPVAIGRANVAGLPGALVTLGATGALAIGSLGSEPQLFRVPALNLAPFEMARCQKELLELEREIRAGVDPSDATIAKAAAERDVRMEVEIDGASMTACTHPTNVPSAGGTVQMCQLSVSIQVELTLEVLQLTIAMDRAVGCSKDSFLFRDVAAHSTERFNVWVYPVEPAPPASLTLTVFCSYTNKQGITRIQHKDTSLPLALFVKSCQPSKEALHKLTLTIAPISSVLGGGLGQLFPEFTPEGGASSALGLQLVTGSDTRKVTIVAAKSTNRFRVQSDELGLMPMMLECLIKRLQDDSPVHRVTESEVDTRKNASAAKVHVTVSGMPAVSELMKALQVHHELGRELKQLEMELEITTGQMRLFERRFVVKLQERSLRALDGILMLLKRNHASVAKVCQLLKQQRHKMTLTRINLVAILNLFNLCFTHSRNTPGGKYLEYLTGLLTPTVIDGTEQSYEEMLLPVVRYLEQTGPLKTGDDQSTAFEEAYLYEVKLREANGVDTSIHNDLLQRYIQRLLGRVNDRFTATGKTSGSGSGRNSVDFEEQPLPEAHNEEAEEEQNEEQDQRTHDGTDVHLSVHLGSTASEWVNYEKQSDLPL